MAGRQSNEYFVWRDGLPYPVIVEPFTKASATSLVAAAAASMYKPKNDTDEEQRFQGMTLMEVTMVRLAEKAADGNFDATVHMLDRLAGKPKQETQNVNVNVTYQDYLDKVGYEHTAEIDATYEAIQAADETTQVITIKPQYQYNKNNLGDL